METVHCNLCGSAVSDKIYDLTDLLLERDFVKTTLVKCSECGLIYQNPRPEASEMGQHYPSNYEAFLQKKKGPVYQFISNVFGKTFSDRAKLVIKSKSGGRLLDIGCATGRFLEYFNQKSEWELFGVELSAYAAEIARNERKLKVFTGTVEEAKFDDNFFDAITMWDVLEHLYDPTATLKEVRRILKPGGIVAFQVPNADSFDVKLFGPYWVGFDSPRHLYVFDHQTIRRMLEKSGFEIINLESSHESYLAFILSVRFFMVGKKWPTSIIQSITQLLNNPFTRLFFSPFFLVYGLAQQSTELSVVAVKKDEQVSLF